MSKFYSFIVAIALVASITSVASAQTDIQAQITALLAQIAQLQAQLGTTQAATATAYNFTKDLTIGSKGDDVTALQGFLESKGVLTMPAGVAKGYFGNLTKTALSAYQSSVSISPAAGYFGPKTRAMVNSTLAAAPATTTGTTTPGTTTPAVSVAEGLTVALASDNPVATTIGSGTAFNSALKVNLTASKDTKVTSITVSKSGFLGNSSLNGVDIVDSKGVRHGNVVTSINADNTVLITMTTDPIVVSAGKTESVTVRFNLVSGSLSGTVAFAITSASAVKSDASAVNGTFPVSGNAMNIVNGGTSLASTTVSVLTSTGSSTLNVDTNSSQEITRFRIAESSSNEALKLYKLTLYNYGSAADSDVKDVQLLAQDGSTVLATAQQASKYITFDLSAAPYEIAKGSQKDLIVKSKIVAGASRTINYVIYNNYDVEVKGTTTGVAVIPAGTFPMGNGYNVQTVGSGSVTFNKASDSPSAAVTPGSSDVVLAKYVAKPVGENMELRQVSFYIATSTVGIVLTGTVTVEVNGATVYSVAASGISTTAASTITLSSYPTLTAGQDNTIVIKGSVNTTAGSTSSYTVKSFDLIQVKRLVTNDLTDPSVSALDGNAISVKAATLAITTMATPVAQSVVSGVQGFEFATIQLNAQAGGEDVRVSKLVVTQTNASTTPASYIKGFALYKDSDTSSLATTASTDTLSSNAVTFNFSSPITVTKTSPVTLHFKGNIMTGVPANTTSTFYVASSSAATTAVGVTTGNTLTHGTDITFSGNGQQMTAVGAGQLLLSLESGSGKSPSANQVVAKGTTSGTYLAFKATSLYEKQKITSLKLTATSTVATPLNITTLTNIKLYEGSNSTPFATAVQFDSCGADGCDVTLTASDNLLSAAVPTTGITIYVKADVGTSAKLGDNFKLVVASSTADVAVKGETTGSTSGTVTGTPTPSGLTYVVPQVVKVEAVSPTTATQVGTTAGQTIAVLKITNTGTAPIYATTSNMTFAQGGTASTSLAFNLYSSTMGGTQSDASVNYGTSTPGTTGASSTVAFGNLSTVSEVNRQIDGGSWRYLTIKTTAAAANNDTFRFSVSALGNVIFYSKESELGYDGNIDGDLSDTIMNLYVDGTPSLETVTAKN